MSENSTSTTGRERKNALMLIDEYIRYDENQKLKSPELIKLDDTQRGSVRIGEGEQLLSGSSVKKASGSGKGLDDNTDEYVDALRRFGTRMYEGRWPSQFYNISVLLTHVLGHSNLIYFPNLCARHGGAAFLIPYLISYVCVGIPILYAEMILGQFSSLPSNEIFRRMSPPLAGIAVAMLAVVVYRSLYFSAVIAQLFYAGAITLQGIWSEGLPGSNCDDPDYNSQFCHAHGIEGTCNASLLSAVHSRKCGNFWKGLSNGNRLWVPPHTDYMVGAVFKPRFKSEDLQLPTLTLSCILFAVWVVAIYCASKGVRSVGRTFAYLKAVSVVIVIISMVYSLFSSSGSDGGVFYFLNPDFQHLANLEAWSSAISHVLFSLSLGDGTVHRLASYNNFNENFIYNAIIVSVCDVLFSLTAGVTFFTAVGTVSASMYPQVGITAQSRIRRTLFTGFTLTFSAFPDQLSLTNTSPLWTTATASAHYFNLAKSGLSNLVMYLELIIIGIKDAMSHLVDWESDYAFFKNTILSVTLLVFGFVCSLVYAGPSGIYLTKLMDEFTAIALLVICFAEIMAVVYAYGFRRFLANVETMIISEDRDWKVSITSLGLFYYVITPFFLLMGVILKAVYNHQAIVADFSFPKYFDFYGWSVVFCCVFMIPLTMLYHFLRLRVRVAAMAALFEPIYLWGPLRAEDREKNIKNERVMRR